MSGGETSTPNRHKSTITGAVPWFMAVVYHGVEVSITDIPYRYHEIKIVSTGLLWPGHFCINPGTTEARPLWIRKSAETHRHEHINGDRFQRKAHGGKTLRCKQP